MSKHNILGKFGNMKTLVTIFIAFALLMPSFGLADDEESKPIILDTDVEDNCDTAEVEVTKIIQPKDIISTGEHEVTASFTTVGINVNGQYDEELNEPWMEHEESPDTNGTPKAHIFTSCDDEYNYVAFEKFSECDPIIAGELFLDTYENQQWDGKTIDTYLSFIHPHTQLLDRFGDPIENTKVAWGDFIEIQIPKSIWPDCNYWAYRITSEECGVTDDCLVDLPYDPITAQIAIDYGDSYFDITLSGIFGDYDVEDGVYEGWCIEYGPIYTPNPHAANLFSTACDAVSFLGIPLENWSKVNFILNHDLGATYNQIQHAIWHFANLGDPEPSPPDSTTEQLILNANNEGSGYIPGSGEVVAVVITPATKDYQHTIIEVTVPEEDCTWNPNWGNNTHEWTTPPNNEFLTFTCTYWDHCECGVGFKGLADIWKIQPGDCITLYETDFENKTNVSKEWIAISFDSNADTWNRTTNRSHSTSHSMHCTKRNEYYGNAIDVLQMKNGLDLSDVVNMTFSFWHWTEGDMYTTNGQTNIADFGIVEMYLPDIECWIPLHDIALTTLYYNNNWEYTEFTIDENIIYNLTGDLIPGNELLQNGNKFRFNWTSDPQFQFEGWYIDDITVSICRHEYYDPDEDLIWQSQSLSPDHWCAPWNSTIEKTFPLKWNALEGKYLLNISLQEEPPWCGQSWMEKIIIVGDIHDVAVIDVDPPAIVEPGDDVDFTAIIKNVGTLDETDVEITAKLRKDGTGSPIMQQSKTIETLNVSEEYTWEFTWEDATYCDYELEVTAFIQNDDVPSNNTKNKWILVADTLFFDHMDDNCNWSHKDLTGGDGHWNICTSGYDDYLWCGLQATTKYDNNWNDVALIDKTFDISDNYTVTVTFNTQYQINEGDYGIVEMSPDDGRHWYAISPEITGDSDWTTLSFCTDVSTQNIEEAQFRFRFYSNDTITDRGWIIDDIIIKTDGFQIFKDNIESGDLDDWIIERLKAGDWWQRVTKAKPGKSSNKAWWCGDEDVDTYPHNLNNVLVLNGGCAHEIDLSKAFAADIIFNTWYDLKDGDIGYVELSINDGDSWTMIGKINGTSEGWEQEWISIDDYLGEIIILRFRFTSDDSGTAEGWYIDDVRILAKLDENPPTSSASISGTMGNNNWYKSTVSISLSATDDYSGVDNIFYRLDGAATKTYSSTITVTTDGNHNIEYWAVDNVGNTESSHTEVFKIDNTNPDIPEITKPGIGIYFRDRKIWPLIDFSLFAWDPPRIIGKITIAVTTADATSGVEKVEFFIDDTLKDEDQTVPYEYEWDERAFQTHTIKVKATDNAGNTAETTKDIKIFNLNLFG